MITIDLNNYDESATRRDIARELIKLPEQHSDYPTLWQSLCGNWRIIRCKDDIQFIVQQYKTPKWRGESFHVDWSSIALIHGDNPAFNTLPDSI